MSRYEVVTLGLTATAFLLYLRLSFRSWATAVGLVGVSLLPLWLSLERASQFLTTDARTIILETLTLDSSPLYQWNAGALRTTDALLGSVVWLLGPALADLTQTQLKSVLKLLHWGTGVAVFIWLHWFLQKHFMGPRRSRSLFVTLVFAFFLLPTNALALKVFNYDLLSLTLAVMGLLYLVVALTRASLGYALAAVVIAFLGAQEKFSASPILVAAVAVTGFVQTLQGPGHRVVRGLKGLILAGCLALLTGTLSAAVVATIRHRGQRRIGDAGADCRGRVCLRRRRLHASLLSRAGG